MSPRLIEDAAAALDPQPPRRRPGLFGRLRSSFLTGLVVIAPIGLTIWLIWTVIGWIDGFVLPPPEKPTLTGRLSISASICGAWGW